VLEEALVCAGGFHLGLFKKVHFSREKSLNGQERGYNAHGIQIYHIVSCTCYGYPMPAWSTVDRTIIDYY
jgi:hypothetical protein